MPLSTAQDFAWSLATTLMSCIILFRAADGYRILPAAEFDGDPVSVVHEYNPFDA